jgi:MscS family membrane protein
MLTFIEAMNRATDDSLPAAERESAWARAVETLDRSGLVSRDEEVPRQIARRLLGVLNRLGEYHRGTLWDTYQLESISNATEQTYFPHPWRFDDVLDRHAGLQPRGRIVLAKQPDGRWLFSADTVAGVEDLFFSLEDLPVIVGVADDLWLRQWMPTVLKGKRLLTLEAWQWVMLFVFILLGIALDFTFRAIVRAVAKRIIERQGGKANPTLMRRAVRPAGLLVMSIFWLNIVTLLGLPDLAHTIVQGAARVFAVLACTLFAWRFTDLLADGLLTKAARTRTKIDDVVIPMVRTAIKIFIVIFALIYGGLSLNFDVTPLLASLTIGGIGFAFAAKDTLENFFGSATVLIDQPFSIGDWIVVGDAEGTVEQIGFRSTRIRTFYNSLITIPNANLVRAKVDNYGKRKYRRWKTNIGVQYDTKPDQLVAFAEGIREIVRCHPYTRKDYFQVWVNEFGPSSINILVYVFHETPDWSTELRERERMMLDIMRLADRLSVQFAFPTQTLHVYKHEGEAPHEPAAAPESLTEKRAMVTGIRAAQGLMANQPWRDKPPGPVRFQAGPTEIGDGDETFIEDRSAGS